MADNDGNSVSSSESSDSTWTPSIGSGEDSDDEDEFTWKEMPLKASRIQVIFDNLDDVMTQNYWEETAEIRRRVTKEVVQLHAGVPGIIRNDEEHHKMTANEIFNAIFHTTLVFELIATMNRWLAQHSHEPTCYNEFQIIIRLIFWCCYYGKGPCVMTKNIENFPEPEELISLLHGNNFSERRERLYNLLRAFDGDSWDDHQQGSMTWSFVYGQDRQLEEMFDKIGRQTSKLCYVEGRTNFCGDDDKLRKRSALAATLGLTRSKGLHSFGPVANCLNSLSTGICLATYMTHHDDNSTDIVRTNLVTVCGTRNSSTMRFRNANLLGDRAYNEESLFKESVSWEIEHTNTTKRGPSLPFKFGNTSYKACRSQRIIPESGPPVVLGATRAVGGRTAFFVAYRNGTGRVTFLQSTRPEFSAENINYISMSQDQLYSKHFQAVLKLKRSREGKAYMGEPLGRKESLLKSKGLREETRVQGTMCWRMLRQFRITSTVSHRLLPTSRMDLTDTEANFLERSLGRTLTQPHEIPLDRSHAHKSTEQLMLFSQRELSEIAKSYGRPYTGTKPKLVLAIQQGPMETPVFSMEEKMLQATFLPPLKDKDKTPHKIGSLNEQSVRNSLGTLLAEFGCEIICLWECGLISQVGNSWLATSLDGWLVYVDRLQNPNVEEHAGLEIKTPTGKEWRELVKTHQSQFGSYVRCKCGDEEFKLLVYKSDYRTQVLHHATATNLEKVFFIVANENTPIYSVLISFSTEQRQTFLGILMGIYDRGLSWAYNDAWTNADPTCHIPFFREEVISRSSYHIDRDTVVFQYVLWKVLLKATIDAEMPLPVAKRIVPAIVAFWNKGKGRIDEMSRYLKEMHWYLAQESPRQALVIREIKKAAVNALLLKRHCWNQIPNTWFHGKSFSEIRKKLTQHEGTLSDFILELAMTYKILSPMPGHVPTSPLKRKQPSEGQLEHAKRTCLDQRFEHEKEASLEQREAETYCGNVKRNKLKKFMEEPVLNSIRLNRSLNHCMLSTGIGARCHLCSAGRNGFHSTFFVCATCQVRLCTIARDGHESTCFDRFHSIQDPSLLFK
jgi:hypothetical protein